MGVQEEDRDGRDPLAKTDLSRDVKVILASNNFNSRIFIQIFKKEIDNELRKICKPRLKILV